MLAIVETRLFGIDEIQVVQPISLVGPVRDLDNGVVPRVRDRDAKTPFRLIRALVDETVLRLWCPSTVVIDLLVQVDAALRLASEMGLFNS